MELRAGSRLKSAVCATEVIAVKAPSDDIDVRCGGVPMLDAGAAPDGGGEPLAGAAEGTLMLHAQIGYRDPEKSRRAWGEIHQAVRQAGGRLDRYGICLDWSMGYPRAERARRPRGTGLILEHAEDFARLTAEAPVAPHFGDFVIGMPAAVENTAAGIANIAEQTETQSASAQQVQVAIKSVSETTESNAASSEQLAASAEELGAQSQALQDLVAKFEV